MKRLFSIAVAALVIPTAAAAQDSNAWWAPLSAELARTASGPTPAYVCNSFPGLPACRDADRADTRTRRPDSNDRWEDRRRGKDRGDVRRDDRDRDNARRGNGPPFCRNGQGHPVHGREWCRDKGWSGGDWRDVSWDDVIFGRDAERRRSDRLGRGGLIDVLGDVVFGRLERQARATGSGSLTGRFVESRGQVLQVRAGSMPLAELLDIDRDGRVDRVLLYSDR